MDKASHHRLMIHNKTFDGRKLRAHQLGRYEYKMRTFVLLSMFVSVCSFAQEEMGVGDAKLYMNMADVLLIKGPPEKTEKTMDWFDTIHTYKDLNLFIYNQDVIVGIESNQNLVCASDGVCVGDKFNEKDDKFSGYRECCSRVYADYNFTKLGSEPACQYFMYVQNEIVKTVATICGPN